MYQRTIPHRQQVPGDVQAETGLTSLKVKDLSRDVTTTAGLLVPVNAQRAWIVIVNAGSFDVYLKLDGAATASTGILVKAAGGSLILDANTPFFGEINAIASGGTSALVVTEVYYE